MATKTNSQRVIEARKKREEERKNSSSKSNTNSNSYSNSDRVRKLKYEREIGFDTFESDLSSVNTTLTSVLGGWQTQETMRNTRSTVESMYKRANDYQTYIEKYQPDAQNNLGELTNYYKQVLDSWDSLAGTYGQYKDADSYTKETAKMKELTSMTKDELASHMKDKNSIAYTTYGGQDITWKGLYDEKDHAERATSKEGAEGWQKYLADTEGKKGNNAGGSFLDILVGSSPVYDMTTAGGVLSQVIHDKRQDKSYQKPTDKWTDEERNIFGSYYLEDPEKAYEYAVQVNDAKLKATEDEQRQMVSDSATSSGWAGAGHTLGSILTAPMAIADYMNDLTDIVAGRPIMSDGVLSPFEYSQEVQGSIGTHLNEKSGTINENVPVIGGKGLGDLYGVGTSIAQSALSGYALGGIGTMISYFGQGASAGVDEALSRGATDEQAMLYGALVGAGEGISEKIGVDRLFKLGSADTVKGFLKNVLKQAGSEGIEEGISSIISEVSDRIVMQDKSVFENAVRTYMTHGMTEAEAKKQAGKDTFNTIAWDAVAGALSGGVHGGIQTAIQSGTENRMNKKVGSVIRENETMDDLKNFASEIGGDAYQKYIDLIDSGKIKDAQLGKFFNEVESKTINDYNSEVDNSRMRQIADMAIELGDTKNSGLIASAVLKEKDGQELTREEKAILKTDTAQAILENIGDNKIEARGSESINKALKRAWQVDSITTPKTVEEKAVASATKEAKAQALENQTRVNEKVEAEGREDISFYSETMEQAKAKAFNEIYDGKTDLESYHDSFELAYTYGKAKIGVSEALKNKGVLTESQALKAYEAGNIGRVIEKQAKVDAINKKYSAKTFVKGTFNDSILREGDNMARISESKTRQQAINFLRAFSEVTGVNVELISSTVGEDNVRRGANGKYKASTNTVYIDIFAGSMDAKVLNDTIIPTLSHEVTHWMKQKSPAMYQKMQDYALEFLADSTNGEMTLNQMITKEKLRMEDANRRRNEPNKKVTDEDAIDELVARTCEDMLTNSDKVRKMLADMSETEQKSFIEKVKETFKNLLEWVNDLLKQYNSASKEAEMLRQYKDKMQELSKMWDATLEEAIKTNQSMKAEGITDIEINGETLVNGISEDGTTIIGENVAQMSERTYEEGGREYLEQWLMKKTKGKKATISKEDAQDILEQTDAIYRIMQDIKNNNDLPDYAKWAETNITTDEDGKKISVIVKNGDYSMNLDVGLVCKKRIALNAVLNALVQSNDLSVYTLTETDVAELNAIIKRHEFEIACALCFVDSKRYRVGSWANSFCEGTEDKDGKKYGFNEMVRSLVPKGSNLQIDEFNFTGRNIINQPTENLLKNAKDSELDFTLIDQIMKDNPPAKNGAKNAQYRYAEAIKNNKDLRSILNPSEIISSVGLDAIRLVQKNLYSLINGHQGTAKPKFAHLSVAFKNDILRATSWTVDKAKMVGGVRLQSFSDFMANMVFDYAQMISELSAKKLTAHAYTKEPLFVKLFGLTGIKINMSLVPKVDLTAEQIERFKNMTDAQKEADAEYQMLKKTAGLRINENGEAEYVWEDETFPYDVAMDIMADGRYTKNCGTIAVGISSAHIRKLLADDRISMVIPYHKSGLNHMVAEMRNIALYNDYTTVQNTRYASGEKLDKKKDKDFDFYADLYGTKKKDGTHDPKQTAENYKKWCAEKGYLPKFDEFKDDANYYKLLIDFTVYDINDNMKYTEQEAVKPVYPSDAEFKDLIVNGVVKNGVTYGGLKQAQDASTRLDQETNQIIDELREVLTKKYGKDVLQAQYSDRDYLDAVNRGDMETAQKMVDEVAKAHGYTTRMYHGSDTAFTKFDKSKIRAVDYDAPFNGFWFSSSEDTSPAMHNAEVTREFYLDISNPAPYQVWRKVSKEVDKEWFGGDADKYFHEESRSTNDEIRYRLQDMGYDSIHWDGIPVVDWDTLHKDGIVTFRTPRGSKYQLEMYWHNEDNSDLAEEFPDGFDLNYDDGENITGYYDRADFESLQEEVWVVFEPSQIKSADAVTYDDNGNVIPLSERFNTESDDIRYSDREQTITSEDTSLNQTPATFTNYEFKSTDRILDWGGGKYDTAKKAMEATYQGIKFEVVDAFNRTKTHNDRILDEYSKEKANVLTINNVLNVINSEAVIESVVSESKQYLAEDGICYIAIYEGSKDGNSKETSAGWQNNQPASWYMQFVEKHYKYVRRQGSFIIASDSPIAGKTSKISTETKATLKQNTDSLKKENLNMKHSVYSDRDYTSVYELMGEKDTLDEENRKLKADIEKLKATIGSEDVKITRFRSLADYLKKQAGSNYSREALGDALKELYNYIQTTDDLKWYNVMAKAEEIANDMMQLNVPINYFREVMTDIRQDKVSLSEEQYAEAVKLYGSYGNLHKALFGSINLTKSGTPLEERWKNWSKAFPTVFKADISAVDMVKELRDTVDALKNTSAVMGEYERQEAIRHMGMEIYNQFWNIASDSSEAVRKERVAHREMMQEFRKDYEERQKEKTLHPTGELALKYEKLLKDTIKRDRAEMKRIRELGNERVKAHKERAERNALIQRITTKSMALTKLLNDNSKTSHVPEVMKPIVRNFLTALDFSSKQYLETGVPTQKDEKFTRALSKVHRMMLNSNNALKTEDGSDYLKTFFPDNLVAKIGDIVDSLEKSMDISSEYVINRMSVDELKTLDMLVSILKSSVTDMNKFIATKHSEGIADLSNAGMGYRDKLGVGKKYGEKTLMHRIQKTLNWNNVNPFFAFKRFGIDGAKIFSAFQDGWDKFAFNVKKIINKAKEIYTEEEIAEWRKDIKRDIEISGGRKVTMTVPQIMALYELQKREQAREHLLGGFGMRIAEIEDGKNVITQPKGTGKLTQQDIDIITDTLTKRQKEVADALQKFMAETGAEWGNEVTMKLYGYRGFEELNYFPIKVNENELVSEANDNGNDIFRLLNMSFTKSVTPNAKTTVMVMDIFDVFAQHTSDMAKYNALALPVYDAFRWYNYKEKDGDNVYSVKTSLETAFGKDGKSYIYTFLKDINGAQNVGRDSLGNSFLSKAKVASVGANLKVMLLQPTSYARASAVIDSKYLVQAFGRKPKFELAEEYCGIAQWKSLGFYDTNIQRGVADLIKHDQTRMERLAEASMKGAGKMDELTIGYLWNACEAEVRDKQKNFKDEKEFYKAVGLRLREVIYNTQVVDSTMTRSQMMRSSDGKDKWLTNFMSEPTLSYNMLHDAYMDYALAVRETGSKEKAFKRHGRKIARTMTAYITTSVVTALLEAGFDAFRDDEEVTEEALLDFFLKNLYDNMSILAKIPLVSEIRSILQGYTSGRLDTQWAQYAKYTINGVRKLWEGEGNPYTTAKNAIRTFSYASGLPFYNVYRDLVASFDSFGLISAEELEEMFNEVFGDIFPSLKIK